MSNKMKPLALGMIFVFALLLTTVSTAAAQTGAAGGAAPGVVAGVAQNVAQAQGIAMVWGDSAAIGANFNFGNPATTSTAGLPLQVQDAITLGEFETFMMALQALLY
ncbi:hypothetical protein K9F62_03860 [Desulfovibrio sp. JY]|nr:hypothetical protein K9F62_03860 [Desulfovibrio sp. JY]